MTKREFMKELEALLINIPDNEKYDALQYYSDYFVDANIEDDMIIPNSIGTPNQVADKIIEEVGVGGNGEQEINFDNDYMSKGFEVVNKDDLSKDKESISHSAESNQSDDQGYYYDTKDDNQKNTSDGWQSNNQQYRTNDKQNSYYNGKSNYSTNNNSEDDNTKLVIAIIIAIVSFPIWIGTVSTIFGLIIGVIAGLIGIILGLGIGGIAVVTAAFVTSVASPPLFVLLLGIGLLMIAGAIAAFIPLILFCGQFLPWLVKEITKLIKYIVGRKE